MTSLGAAGHGGARWRRDQNSMDTLYMALTLFHMLVFLCILVYSCAFLMYSVEYGQFWEMCRIRVEYG